MNINLKTYCNVMYICMMIYAVSLCVTIAGAPLAIPIFIGASKFNEAKNYSMQQFKQNNTTLLVWGIVFGAIASPAGTVAIIFAIFAYIQIGKEFEVNAKFEDVKPKQAEETPGQKQETPEEIEAKEKQRKKEATLASLKRLKESGIITEEEYQRKVDMLEK